MKPLKIWRIAIVLNLFASGCSAKMPDRTLCDLQTNEFVKHANDATSLEDLKAILNGGQPVSCFDTKTQKSSRKTLKAADKHIAVSLPDFQKIDNYIFELEKKAEQCR